MSRLVAYTSSQAHSSVQKAAMLSATRIRLLPVDEANGLSLDADVLAKTIEQDRRKGLIPFIVIATLGTTNTCAFDNLQTIGPVCKDKAVFSLLQNFVCQCGFYLLNRQTGEHLAACGRCLRRFGIHLSRVPTVHGGH